MALDKTVATVPVLQAIKKAGCPLCTLWTKAEDSYLEAIETNEMAMDSEFRRKVVKALGFCNVHMHSLYEVAFGGRSENGLGYARYEKEVVDGLRAVFSALRPSGRSRGRGVNFVVGSRKGAPYVADVLRKAVVDGRRCPACDHLLESDRRVTVTFVEMLKEAAFAEQFSESDGLCLQHTLSALELAPESRARTDLEAVEALLLRVAVRRFEQLSALLEQRIRKYSWTNKNEKLSRAEASSQETALWVLAGVRNLYCRSTRASILSALR